MLYCLLTLSRRIAMSLIVIVVISDMFLTVGLYALSVYHTTSAKVFSIFRKYKAPPIRTLIATMEDTAIIKPGAVPVPRSAQRNPSTTPAIGLMPYKVRQDSDKRLVG